MHSVFLIGDSISVHYAPFLEQYLEGCLNCIRNRDHGTTLLALDSPMGANLGDSGRVLQFVRETRATGGIHADSVLFNCGLHDIRTTPDGGKKKTSLPAYIANLENITRELWSMKVKPIWVHTTPCDDQVHNTRMRDYLRFNEDVVAYNTAASQVMKESDIPIIDLYRFTENLGKGPSLYVDHVHYEPHVREKQAAFIAGHLMRFLTDH